MRSIMVYDPRTRTTSRYGRRYFRLFDVGWFDFSPATGDGLLSVGDRLTNRLFRLGRSGIAQLRVPSANVGKPVWSPDGTRIALSGVAAGAGPDTPTRTDTPWSVFMLREAGGGFREIVGGLDEDPLPAWSPDGKWLALIVEYNRPNGLWLVRVSTGKEFLLLRGKGLQVPEWLPDGRIVVPVGGAADLGYRGRYGLLVIRMRLP
jgi:Tol biopolymer transport system component